MNVLHVIVGLDRGGAELMLERLLRSSKETSRVVHSVVSLTTVGSVGKSLLDSGFPVSALDLRSFSDVPSAAFKLRKLILADPPDIVQTWMYHANLIGGLIARSCRVRRIVWGVRSTDVRVGTSRTTRIIRRVSAPLSHWIPTVIVCAAEAARRSHAADGYDSSRMVVIPNGFEVPDLSVVREQRAMRRATCNWPEGEVVIGLVGRFNPVKDQANFVRAAGALADQFGDVRFLLLGKGLDWSNLQLRRWICDTRHETRFHLLGEQQSIDSWYAAMDVLCLSSRSEAFPNVVGEAMARAIPCVVTDVGDARALVGSTGHVVEKGNPAALAEALARFVSMTPRERREHGMRGRERIVAHYSLAQVRSRFEDLYEQLYNRRTPSDASHV